MLEAIKNINTIKRIRKKMWYSRVRQRFPMPEPKYVDDRNQLDHAEVVRIEWPTDVKKPVFGIVQDNDHYPKWTKFRRFLENNSFDFGIYSIHCHDWIEQAQKFDVIVGIPSSAFYHLSEIRSKYETLETYLGKTCYPSSAHTRLYEDKCLEAYISKFVDIPFAKAYISNDEKDALHLLKSLKYPQVSKIVPSSGSQGVELVRNIDQGQRIIRQTFSRFGRKTHQVSYRQKNLVYFQEFIPNDGYDIRVIVVGDWVFGSYRQVAPGDFRASGMKLEVRRELPAKAMDIARRLNRIIRSPVLAVDMVHGLDGNYYVIEYSPYFQMDTYAEYRLNGIPGVNIFHADGSYHFQEGKYWIAELALREFLLKRYLPETIKANLSIDRETEQ